MYIITNFSRKLETPASDCKADGCNVCKCAYKARRTECLNLLSGARLVAQSRLRSGYTDTLLIFCVSMCYNGVILWCCASFLCAGAATPEFCFGHKQSHHWNLINRYIYSATLLWHFSYSIHVLFFGLAVYAHSIICDRFLCLGTRCTLKLYTCVNQR